MQSCAWYDACFRRSLMRLVAADVLVSITQTALADSVLLYNAAQAYRLVRNNDSATWKLSE